MTIVKQNLLLYAVYNQCGSRALFRSWVFPVFYFFAWVSWVVADWSCGLWLFFCHCSEWRFYLFFRCVFSLWLWFGPNFAALPALFFGQLSIPVFFHYKNSTQLTDFSHNLYGEHFSQRLCPYFTCLILVKKSPRSTFSFQGKNGRKNPSNSVTSFRYSQLISTALHSEIPVTKDRYCVFFLKIHFEYIPS